MGTLIYHNPHCSKSRQALQLIQEKGIEPEIIEYLKTPPDAETLDNILTQLGIEPRDLMRTGQEEYKTLGLAETRLTREVLIQAMVDTPILIERPIVVTDKGIAIGRPPKNINKVLP